MKRILHVTAEAAPHARTGGLGDAAMGLAGALAHGGERDVVVVTPRYGVSRGFEQASWFPEPVPVRVGTTELTVGVRELVRAAGEPRVLFVEHDDLFAGRAGVYGDAAGFFGDNGFRFAVLSAAALEISKRLWPEHGHDLLHAHDWHAALAVLYARLDDRFRMRPSVLTVHNLAHQGLFAQDALGWLGLPAHWYVGAVLEHGGGVNLMKGALALADRVTTVSPHYAREITTPLGGFGLDAHLAYHRDKLRGIVNGIDTAAYDPQSDAALPRTYEARSSAEGKADARRASCIEFGLDADPVDGSGPLFGVVSRFDGQKGLDVLFRVVPELVAWGARVAILGQGEPALEQAARGLAERHPGRVGVRVEFDDQIARRLYAAAHFVVVPSRFEPCGLSQLYAMRYGAMPIVSRTGGLLDTVAPLRFDSLEVDEPPSDDRRGPGLLVEPGHELALLDACVRACELSSDAFRMQRLRERSMARDFSWARSASEMAELYASLL